MEKPKVGQEIYVGSQMYMSHGEDDFAGGKATIDSVKEVVNGGKPDYCVTIKERPGHGYYWRHLESQQAEYAKRFGDRVAHSDPDTRPEFNCWATPGDIVTTSYQDPKTGEWVTTKRTVTRNEP